MKKNCVKLGSICTFQSGGTPSRGKAEYYNGHIPWITTVALNGGYIDQNSAVEWITDEAIRNSAAKIVPAYSMMVGTRVGIGKASINRVAMATSQDVISLLDIDDKVWSKEYLLWFIRGKSAYLQSQSRGATIKGVNIETVSALDVPKLPIEEQKELAGILKRAENLMIQRRKQLAAFDTLINARFVEMFGIPGEDVKGWGLQPLGKCCELNPKKGADKRLIPGLNVSFVPMPAVTENGEIDVSEVRAYEEVKTGFTYFIENDVLFAKITPCMENGKGAIAVGLCNGIGFGSTEFHVFRPIAGKSNSYWLYSLTSFDSFRKDAAANMTGSAGQRRVPATFLDNYKVALPPIALQNQFAAFVTQVDKSKFGMLRDSR